MRYRILIWLWLAAGCALGVFASDTAAERVARLRGRLERGLHDMKTLQADFVQTRKFRSLDAEWNSQGRMALAEARMAWIVEKPMLCCFLMTREKVGQWDEDSGKVLELNVKDQPWLKVMYESLNSWLRGDLAVLERDFVLSAPAGERTLRMTPRSGTFYADWVRQLELGFDREFRYAETIRIEEKNGDLVTIVLQHVKINQAIPETVWRIPPVLKKP